MVDKSCLHELFLFDRLIFHDDSQLSPAFTDWRSKLDALPDV